jgi:hypothetical protein
VRSTTASRFYQLVLLSNIALSLRIWDKFQAAWTPPVTVNWGKIIFAPQTLKIYFQNLALFLYSNNFYSYYFQTNLGRIAYNSQ